MCLLQNINAALPNLVQHMHFFTLKSETKGDGPVLAGDGYPSLSTHDKLKLNFSIKCRKP